MVEDNDEGLFQVLQEKLKCYYQYLGKAKKVLGLWDQEYIALKFPKK